MDRPVNPFDRPPADDEPSPFDTGDAADDDDLARFDALADDDVFLAEDEALFGSEAPAASDDTAVGEPAPEPAAPSFPPTPVTSSAPATSAGPAAVSGSAAISSAPAAGAAPAPAAGAATALLDHDDEPVGLFARTPFAPGAGPRVDLLPTEVVTVRRVRRAQRRGVAALVGVLVLVAAAYVLVSGERSMAREDLAAAQQRTVELTAEQARYARAPIVYAQVDDTRTALASVMGRDVRWYDYLSNLAVTAPGGLWLTSWQATVGDQDVATATPAVDPSTGLPFTEDTLATLSFSGTTSQESDVVAWLRVLGTTPGLKDPGATSLTRTAVGDQPVVTFDSSASMTDAALSDRYAPRKD